MTISRRSMLKASVAAPAMAAVPFGSFLVLDENKKPVGSLDNVYIKLEFHSKQLFDVREIIVVLEDINKQELFRSQKVACEPGWKLTYYGLNCVECPKFVGLTKNDVSKIKYVSLISQNTDFQERGIINSNVEFVDHTDSTSV